MDTQHGNGSGYCRGRPGSQLEEHYKTFIVRLLDVNRPLKSDARTVMQTEQHFAEIAGAGLNWVRLPIPFWAIDTWEPEPFPAKTA
jgi:glucan 1,3-beta-glucosidase